MNILSYERSLHESISYENMLLASLSCLSLNGLLYSITICHLASLKGLKIRRALCDSHISDSLSKILEVSIAAYKVSLTAKTYDYALAVNDTSLNRTLGGLTVRSLSRNQFALLPDDVHSLVEISLSFLKSLLAVHHTGRSHFT